MTALSERPRAYLQGKPLRLTYRNRNGDSLLEEYQTLTPRTVLSIKDPLKKKDFLSGCNRLFREVDGSFIILGYGYRLKGHNLISGYEFIIGDDSDISLRPSQVRRILEFDTVPVVKGQHNRFLVIFTSDLPTWCYQLLEAYPWESLEGDLTEKRIYRLLELIDDDLISFYSVFEKKVYIFKFRKMVKYMESINNNYRPDESNHDYDGYIRGRGSTQHTDQ